MLLYKFYLLLLCFVPKKKVPTSHFDNVVVRITVTPIKRMYYIHIMHCHSDEVVEVNLPWFAGYTTSCPGSGITMSVMSYLPTWSSVKAVTLTRCVRLSTASSSSVMASQSFTKEIARKHTIHQHSESKPRSRHPKLGRG